MVESKNIKLSILIPTLPKRKAFLDDLLFNLHDQIGSHKQREQIEILISADENESIGAKRNLLLSIAEGEYTCFIDDDDEIDKDYIKTIMQGISKNPDCISLRGILSIDGKIDGTFEHSIKYNAYRTVYVNQIKYERYPNHLNTIKASIAKQFKFKEINHGEDTDWATQIYKSKLLKNEYYTDKILYYYKYRSKK